MKLISVVELKERLAKDEVTLIDVREPAEFRSEAIAGATLIPLGECSLAKLPAQDKPIVIHCRSGKRSADACLKLLASDPNLDVASLDGGIIAWQQAGFATKSTGKKMLPVGQQTQIVIGLLTLLGTLAGIFLDARLLVLPGLMGAGLIFAGLSGWCGMAILLSKMPWNQ